MNLETRAREAASSLHAATMVDAERGLERLHRIHQRRTTGKVLTTAAAIALGIGLVQVQRDDDRAEPPVSPPTGWVLVSGSGVPLLGDPVDEWSEPLRPKGEQTYPGFAAADPGTRRFLIGLRGAAWQVMTPGRAEPLATIECGEAVCLPAALGPGPDELTMTTEDFRLVVVDPQGQTRRDLGSAWTPPTPGHGRVEKLAWAPDGKAWAEVRFEQRPAEASVAVVLRDASSSEVTTLYEFSEAAPPGYDGGTAGDPLTTGWGSPLVLDLQWSPDSSRVAFMMGTLSKRVRQGTGSRIAYQLQLFVADTAVGTVERVADFGTCGRRDDCMRLFPSLAWAPGGETLTVLLRPTLFHYDLTGGVLDSEPTNLEGPLVWIAAE